MPEAKCRANLQLPAANVRSSPSPCAAHGPGGLGLGQTDILFRIELILPLCPIVTPLQRNALIRHLFSDHNPAASKRRGASPRPPAPCPSH